MNVRSVLYRAAALVCLVSVAACEPASPLPAPPVFAVNVDGIGVIDSRPDASLGDGVCEATPGHGDCTVSAAFGEGNAQGRAVVVLDDYQAVSYDLEVTGTITIRSADENQARLLRTGTYDLSYITVAAGASLAIENVWTELPVTVHGGLHLIDSVIESYRVTALEVGAGGVAAVGGSTLRTHEGRAVRNGGTALVVDSMIGGVLIYEIPHGFWESHLGGLDTLPGGTTYLLDTWLASNYGSVCTGPAVVSLGGNKAPDGTCSLDGPGDIEDEPQFIINPDVVPGLP